MIKPITFDSNSIPLSKHTIQEGKVKIFRKNHNNYVESPSALLNLF